METSVKLAPDERLSWLRTHLDTQGRLRSKEAAKALGVSEMTIRRDIQELEAAGVAWPVRGGAVAIGPRTFAQRHRLRARAKARIATKLATLVPETGSIALDPSSTVLRLVGEFPRVRDLLVVTNGRETFEALQKVPGVNSLLTGGRLDPGTGSLVGPLACRAASDVLASHLFFSAAAVDPDAGPSEACLEEAEVKRSFATPSAQIVLAADSSKLGTKAVARTFPWERIGVLVTELDPADARLDVYRSLVKLL